MSLWYQPPLDLQHLFECSQASISNRIRLIRIIKKTLTKGCNKSFFKVTLWVQIIRMENVPLMSGDILELIRSFFYCAYIDGNINLNQSQLIILWTDTSSSYSPHLIQRLQLFCCDFLIMDVEGHTGIQFTPGDHCC